MILSNIRQETHLIGGVIPMWLELLSERGLSPVTTSHFELSPRGQGWVYPVHPRFDEVRWKAFDSGSTPKYLWLPNKPDGIQFYDVDGCLPQRVAESGGVLWLASGEADVWALWEGGIENATCLFDGEARRIPEWFLPKLEQLNVSVVHLAPDCDDTGWLFAAHVCQAVQNSSIAAVVHELPFAMGSRSDIGQLLLAVGAEDFREILERLPELEIDLTAVPVPEETSEPVYWQLPLPKILPDYRALYEEWSTAVVEAAALYRWNISAPNGKGFSKSFRCPFHDDRHPSASWNYHTHGIYCFACGKHDTKAVAERLGVIRWQDFKLDNVTV